LGFQADLIEAGNGRHEHEIEVCRNLKLAAGKILIPGVVSHATDLVERPELVVDRMITLAEIVGQEKVVAGADCGLGGRGRGDREQEVVELRASKGLEDC